MGGARSVLEDGNIACEGRATRSQLFEEKHPGNVPWRGVLVCKEKYAKFPSADLAQVDVLDVLDVRQVLRQRELAAVVEVDLASLGADVADHADDGSGEDTCERRLADHSSWCGLDREEK